VRLARRKPLLNDRPAPGSIAATIAAAIKAKRDELTGPKPGHCAMCANRWGKALLIGSCICTGDVQLGRPDHSKFFPRP